MKGFSRSEKENNDWPGSMLSCQYHMLASNCDIESIQGLGQLVDIIFFLKISQQFYGFKNLSSVGAIFNLEGADLFKSPDS
jgi:hypothetical protein